MQVKTWIAVSSSRSDKRPASRLCPVPIWKDGTSLNCNSESDLRFADLVEPGSLSRIGADGRLLTGSYKISQQWSAALRNHPARPDGIRYRSRRDPAKIAYAIYECPSSTFSVSEHGSLMEPKNRSRLNRLLQLYHVDLIEV